MNTQYCTNHLWIFGSVGFIVYSQCIIRWRLMFLDELPSGVMQKIPVLLNFLFTPWVISAMLATFLSGLFWIVALTKFELTYAYPWMASVFLLMLFCGVLFFGESYSILKLFGTTLVVLGLILVTRG